MSALCDYFTYWNAAATAAALPALAGARLAGARAPSAGVALVIGGVVVGVMGSWVLAYRMQVPERFHRDVLRSQIWLHVMPLVIALVLMAAWPAACGAAAQPRHVARGVAAYGALFAVWLATPTSRSRRRGLSKVQEVYHTPEPAALLAVGVGVAGAAAALCVARGDARGHA